MDKRLKFGILVLLIILIIFLTKYFNLVQYLKPEILKETIKSFGIWAPFIYILIYTAATILFLPASPITIAGGLIFGSISGTIYTVIGATIGASIAFLVARYLGGSFVSGILKKSKLKNLEEYYEKLEKNGFVVVLFLRFIPIFPFNVLNFALGLTKVKFRDYFLATLIGIIPGTFVYTYLGDSLGTLNPIKIGIAIGLVILLSLIYPIYKYLKKKKSAKEWI